MWYNSHFSQLREAISLPIGINIKIRSHSSESSFIGFLENVSVEKITTFSTSLSRFLSFISNHLEKHRPPAQIKLLKKTFLKNPQSWTPPPMTTMKSTLAKLRKMMKKEKDEEKGKIRKKKK